MDSIVLNFDGKESVNILTVIEHLRNLLLDRAKQFEAEKNDIIVCVVYPKDIPEFLSVFGEDLKK